MREDIVMVYGMALFFGSFSILIIVLSVALAVATYQAAANKLPASRSDSTINLKMESK